MAYRKDDGRPNNAKKGGYRQDPMYDGESTRPKKFQKSDAFFGKGAQNKPGSGKPDSGYNKGRRDASGGYTPSSKPYGTPAQEKRQYGAPSQERHGQHGDSPRPAKPYGAPAQEKRGQYGDSPRPAKPYGAPPRTAAPRYAVPASVRDQDAPVYAPVEHAIEMPENLLVGRNPIREAIKAGRTIEKLLVVNGELSGSAREIVAKAHENHIVVQKVDKSRLDAIYPKHQGMLAYVSEATYSSVEEILAVAKEKNEDPFIVALDGITDPHNLGAIIRTAECAGAHGVIITERRSAGLNPAAVKASAGALSYIKVAKVVNLSRALDELKEEGLWITGSAMDGEPVDTVDLTGPIALVIGSEGEGISQLVRKNCDRTVSLPIKGQIDSLNASVAAGILLYAVLGARA